LQKEIRELKQRQTKLERFVYKAFAARPSDLPYGGWELKPEAVKRITRALKNIRAGKGTVVRTPKELRSFFDKL